MRRLLGVFSAGRILNALTARSQAIDGLIWGLGSALHEETFVEESLGRFLNLRPATCLWPSCQIRSSARGALPPAPICSVL